MQRRHHYEQAFEHYLRSRRIPYVAVDEARKALVPGAPEGPHAALKSFDFVLYAPSGNLLAEVKGRKIAPGRGSSRLQSWVTQDDVDSLLAWESLFGPGFSSAFIFMYWCDEQPPLPLFEEIFELRGRWYAVRSVPVREYARAMRPRSPRWRTVHLPTREFDRLSRPIDHSPRLPALALA